MTISIWHNPRCSKSRQTLQLLRDHGIDPEVIEYLKTPPSREALVALLKSLNIKPRDLMRKSETVYKENGLAHLDNDEDLIDEMIKNPILIERPIVINDGKAAIGRPPENVLSIM